MQNEMKAYRVVIQVSAYKFETVTVYAHDMQDAWSKATATDKRRMVTAIYES